MQQTVKALNPSTLAVVARATIHRRACIPIAATPTRSFLQRGTRPLASVTGGNILGKVPRDKVSNATKPKQPLVSQQKQPEPPRLPAVLRLQTGQTFAATSFGAPLTGKQNKVGGEIVFTTALVGYPESMTDPSYRGQILVFTQPLVGNYGVPANTRDEFGLLRHFEADGIQVQGIIVSDYAAKYSHWNAVESLGQWCARYGVPALTGVDTRAVVTLLRERGSTLAEICIGDTSPTDLREKATIETKDPNEKNLVAEASTKTVTIYNPDGDSTVLLIDCGAKQNIIRSLAKRGARVMVVPWDFDLVRHYKAIQDASSNFATKKDAKSPHAFDGVFISNGPGNPQAAIQTARNLRAFMQLPYAKTLPMFGICMGNQLMGLAAGFGSYKLKYGNRGHNQPAINLVTGKCVITSQNHGYALDDTSVETGHPVPGDWIPFFRNANDGSNEGIRHVAHPWSSVQFHPEAMGGPLDTDYLFDEFLSDVREYKARRNQSGRGIALGVEAGLGSSRVGGKQQPALQKREAA